ncbi:MAG: glutathione S-transferase family protein [Hyphomonadaceae bacterium]
MFWESTTWDPAVAILAFERVVKGLFGLGGPDPARVEDGERKFHTAAAVLNEHLTGRKHICGDALSLADFSVAAALSLAEPAQLRLEPYAEVRRWAATMTELPAWRAVRAMQRPAAAA